MSEMHNTNPEVENEAKTPFWKDPEWRKSAKETAIETGVTLIVGIGIQVTIGLASQAIIKQVNAHFDAKNVEVPALPETTTEA